MSQVVLTNCQQKAFDAILSFLADPTQTFFVVEGFAGTGKTFMMKEVIKEWGRISEAIQLICPTHNVTDMVFTATTNKAAEELQRATGWKTKTIHSALGLTVRRNYETGQPVMTEKPRFEPIQNSVIIIDECSYLDDQVISKLLSRTVNCKFIFLGDPAQLVPVGYKHAPIFLKQFPTVRMTEVKRNGGKILDLATAFREAVTTGVFPQFKPDGQEIVWLNGPDFQQAIDAEFGRKLWNYEHSKVLAWRNNTAIAYSKYIREQVMGDSDIQVGDFVSVNTYVQHPSGKASHKTDSIVLIQEIGPEVEEFGYKGHWIKIDGLYYFNPVNYKDRARALTRAQAMQNKVDAYQWGRQIDAWIDLRALTAQTINKAQGSTYKKVFIDLNDIAECSSGDSIARMLYVGTSRASQQVIFTGDLV